jgi:hypothetical protein
LDSRQLPVLSDRNGQEIIGKISGRNTASTKSPELPGTGSFRPGLFDLGTYNINITRSTGKYSSYCNNSIPTNTTNTAVFGLNASYHDITSTKKTGNSGLIRIYPGRLLQAP